MKIIKGSGRMEGWKNGWMENGRMENERMEKKNTTRKEIRENQPE